MASSARFAVVAGLFVLSLITYIDRAAISSAKDAMSAELALDDKAVGAVFSAFALGYAIAQIPSGWLADRFGPRWMLATVVLVWSALTALTGATATLSAMLAVRFLFGVAEAGAFPGAARAFYNWLPAGERGRANGIMFSGSRIGGAVAFPLMAWLLENWRWRTAFFLLALPGIAWAAGWALLFRNEPAQPPPREEEDGETGGNRRHEALPFGELIRTRPMLLAMLQYFATNFITFLCLSWMNPFLKQRYQLTTREAAYYSMVVLLVSATAQWANGWLVDRLYRSTHRAWSRRLPATIGFLLAACGIAAIPFASTAGMGVLCFTIAAFGAEMTISPSWAFCMDIGGKRSGALSGAMNMAGNFASFLSANAFPMLAAATGGADAYFWLVCALSLMGAACWSGMRYAVRS